jgi:hypothetical protein
METKIVTVTPETASLWLQKNTNNRTINSKRVRMYADEMKNGKWFLHHQGIAFFDDGSFADGQHRLAAIVLSGCAIDMSVTFGLKKEASIIIDSHQKRETHQAIQMSGIEWLGKDEVAIINLLISIKGNGSFAKSTNQEIVDFGEKHKTAIQFVTGLVGQKKRGLTSAVVLSSLVCAYYKEDANELAAFFNVLISGMPRNNKDKAAILIRDWLMSTSITGGPDRNNAVKKIMRAIMAFCQKQELGKLYQPDEFLYKCN